MSIGSGTTGVGDDAILLRAFVLNHGPEALQRLPNLSIEGILTRTSLTKLIEHTVPVEFQESLSLDCQSTMEFCAG